MLALMMFMVLWSTQAHIIQHFLRLLYYSSYYSLELLCNREHQALSHRLKFLPSNSVFSQMPNAAYYNNNCNIFTVLHLLS